MDLAGPLTVLGYVACFLLAIAGMGACCLWWIGHPPD